MHLNIISPRYLRQHTDKLAVNGIDEQDVVIDSQEEILWRLRSLCGLKNTLDAGIVAMDGANREPARILTHFESDYGAAPKVEMHKGQVITNIIPDFNVSRYVGLKGTILDAPFMDALKRIGIEWEQL